MEDVKVYVIFRTMLFGCKVLHLDRGWLGRITNCHDCASTKGLPFPWQAERLTAQPMIYKFGISRLFLKGKTSCPASIRGAPFFMRKVQNFATERWGSDGQAFMQ